MVAVHTVAAQSVILFVVQRWRDVIYSAKNEEFNNVVVLKE